MEDLPEGLCIVIQSVGSPSAVCLGWLTYAYTNIHNTVHLWRISVLSVFLRLGVEGEWYVRRCTQFWTSQGVSIWMWWRRWRGRGMMDEKMDAGIIRDRPLTVDFMSSPLPNSFGHQRTQDFQFTLMQTGKCMSGFYLTVPMSYSTGKKIEKWLEMRVWVFL